MEHDSPVLWSKSTIHEHFERWAAGGVFDAIFQLSSEKYDELQGIEWEWQAMDGGIVQAPTRQAGGASAKEEGLGKNPTDRGRQGSKLHILVDQNGIPLGLEIIGANVHDSRLVGSTLETLVLERPKITAESPQNLCLDKGYDYKRVEEEVKSYGYQPHIRRIGEEKFDNSKENIMDNGKDREWLKGLVAAWNSHDAGRVASFYAEDGAYEPEAGGTVLNGREAIKAYVGNLCATIPDFALEVKSNFFSGTSGVAEFVMSGTPKGTLPSGLPATGKSFSVKLCGISEVEGDLIKRTTNYWDRATFLTQLGLMPSAPR